MNVNYSNNFNVSNPSNQGDIGRENKLKMGGHGAAAKALEESSNSAIANSSSSIAPGTAKNENVRVDVSPKMLNGKILCPPGTQLGKMNGKQAILLPRGTKIIQIKSMAKPDSPNIEKLKEDLKKNEVIVPKPNTKYECPDLNSLYDSPEEIEADMKDEFEKTELREPVNIELNELASSHLRVRKEIPLETIKQTVINKETKALIDPFLVEIKEQIGKINGSVELSKKTMDDTAQNSLEVVEDLLQYASEVLEDNGKSVEEKIKGLQKTIKSLETESNDIHDMGDGITEGLMASNEIIKQSCLICEVAIRNLTNEIKK